MFESQESCPQCILMKGSISAFENIQLYFTQSQLRILCPNFWKFIALDMYQMTAQKMPAKAFALAMNF